MVLLLLSLEKTPQTSCGDGHMATSLYFRPGPWPAAHLMLGLHTGHYRSHLVPVVGHVSGSSPFANIGKSPPRHRPRAVRSTASSPCGDGKSPSEISVGVSLGLRHADSVTAHSAARRLQKSASNSVPLLVLTGSTSNSEMPNMRFETIARAKN